MAASATGFFSLLPLDLIKSIVKNLSIAEFIKFCRAHSSFQKTLMVNAVIKFYCVENNIPIIMPIPGKMSLSTVLKGLANYIDAERVADEITLLQNKLKNLLGEENCYWYSKIILNFIRVRNNFQLKFDDDIPLSFEDLMKDSAEHASALIPHIAISLEDIKSSLNLPIKDLEDVAFLYEQLQVKNNIYLLLLNLSIEANNVIVIWDNIKKNCDIMKNLSSTSFEDMQKLAHIPLEKLNNLKQTYGEIINLFLIPVHLCYTENVFDLYNEDKTSELYAELQAELNKVESLLNELENSKSKLDPHNISTAVKLIHPTDNFEQIIKAAYEIISKFREACGIRSSNTELPKP